MPAGLDPRPLSGHHPRTYTRSLRDGLALADAAALSDPFVFPVARVSPPEQTLPAAAPEAEALPRVEDLARREVLGSPLAVVDYDRAMDAMDGLVARREPGSVSALAVHAVTLGHTDAEMRAALDRATLLVPDGMPVVWALNALGAGLTDRVYGPELMWRYTARCAERGHRVWLYGGHDQGTLAQLTLNLRRSHPGLQIVGGYSPPFRPLTAEEEDELVAQINRDRPDVLWVGVGVPKQEKWMAHMRDRLDVPVMAAVGAAFDFHAGRVSQAPDWMQARGLEWIYRIAQEPRRLLPRYLYYNPRFLAAFARQYLGERLRRSFRPA